MLTNNNICNYTLLVNMYKFKLPYNADLILKHSNEKVYRDLN